MFCATDPESDPNAATAPAIGTFADVTMLDGKVKRITQIPVTEQAYATKATPSASYEWHTYCCTPTSVKYSIDDYSSEKYLTTYLVNSSGAKMSNSHTCRKGCTTKIAIYDAADNHNALKARIENSYKGQGYNMKFSGKVVTTASLTA